MAVQTINIGNLVNDGLGDDLRTAFNKVNQNFAALDNQLSVTGKNVGTSGTGIFKQKTNFELEFKKLAGSSNVAVVEANDVITISSPLQNTFRYVTANGNGQTAVANTDADTLTFEGSDNITVTAVGNTIKFEAEVVDGQLSKDLDLNTYDILGTGNITINGTVTANNFIGTVNGYNITQLGQAVYDIDFGNIDNVADNSIQYLFASGDHDFGTVVNPSSVTLDLGTL